MPIVVVKKSAKPMPFNNTGYDSPYSRVLKKKLVLELVDCNYKLYSYLTEAHSNIT